MPKSKKPSDQRLREPLPSLEEKVDTSKDNQSETSIRQNTESSTNRQDDTPKTRDSDKVKGLSDDAEAGPSQLQKQMQMLMEDVDIPGQPPRMTEKTNAHISKDADNRLREAVRILEMRYGKRFSKSLLVEYVLRGALWDLQEHSEKSQIIRVLDQVFSAE